MDFGEEVFTGSDHPEMERYRCLGSPVLLGWSSPRGWVGGAWGRQVEKVPVPITLLWPRAFIPCLTSKNQHPWAFMRHPPAGDPEPEASPSE